MSEKSEKPKENNIIANFITRVERLEKRHKGNKFADTWLVPKEELIAVRNALSNSTVRRVKRIAETATLSLFEQIQP